MRRDAGVASTTSALPSESPRTETEGEKSSVLFASVVVTVTVGTLTCALAKLGATRELRSARRRRCLDTAERAEVEPRVRALRVRR